MKSEGNIKYQRDIYMELTKLCIKKFIVDLKEKNLSEEELLNKKYDVQSLLNTLKVLDWIYNTEDECDIDDYYTSHFESKLEEEVGLSLLSKELEKYETNKN